MRIDTTSPEYGILQDGLIEHAKFTEFVDAHKSSLALDESSGFVAEEYRTAEWQNIKAIEAFQRDEITPDFERRVSPWNALPSGNCFTHSTRTAELLEACGYEVGISFTNEHTFVLVRSARPDTGYIYMLNPDMRTLSIGEITHLEPEQQLFPKAAIEQMQINGFTEPVVTSMYTDPLRRHVAYMASRGRMAYQTPWVDARFPATVITDLATAKDALFKYSSLNTMLGKSPKNVDDHFQAVTDAIRALQGINPQMETRQKLNRTLKLFRHQIRRWAQGGVPTDSIEGVIEAFAAMMPDTFSRDVYVGDIYRMYAKHANLGEAALRTVLGKSVKSYLVAENRCSSGGKEVIKQKMDKCYLIARSAGVSLLEATV